MQHSWSFQKRVAADRDGLTDVVVGILWRLDAQDEDGVTAFTTGEVALPAPEPHEFKPLSEITDEDCLAWVTAQIELETIAGRLAEQIGMQRESPTYIV